MSLGLTPHEFVQQVFYVQEKVLLDFYPDDDVYKEVLMEANLVLQELQKEEDWLWLRDTVNLGFVSGIPPLERNKPEDFHWHRWQHDIQIKIPDTVYKPSRLYGDCVRLCRYRVRSEFFEPFVNQQLGYKKHWEDVVKTKTITPDRTLVFYGEVAEPNVNVTDYKYGGSFTWPISLLDDEDLPKYVERGKWYTDTNGCMLAGDIETPDEDPYGVQDTETPCKIYLCYPDEPIDPVTPDSSMAEFDPTSIEPAPHGFLEGLRYWYPFPWWPGDNAPFLIWDNEYDTVWQFIEIFENDAINVPYMSAGNMYHRDVRQNSVILQPHMGTHDLGAIVNGNVLTFNRPLNPCEMNRVVLMDAQMRIEQFHICGQGCLSKLSSMSGTSSIPSYPDNPCIKALRQAEERMLKYVPDPNYVIYRTAALHAQGSPPAQGRVMDITDTANKLLSAMRQNNAEATMPDYVDYDPIDFVNVI